VYCSRAASGIEANKTWFDVNEFNAIRYYASSGGLSVPDGTQRLSYYGISAYPTTQWNGTTTLVGAGTDVINGLPYRSIIENTLATPSYFKITVNSVSLTPPTGTIDVDIEVMEDVPSIATMKIRMALTEGNVFFDGVDDWHEDVLRDMATDVQLTVGSLGQVQNVQAQFPIQGDWVPDELAVITFIQDDSNKQVMASASSDTPPDYSLRFYALGDRVVVGPPSGTYSYDRFRIYNTGALSDNYTVSVSLDGHGSGGWTANLRDESMSYGSEFSQVLAPGEYKELWLEMNPNSTGYATATVTMTQDNWPNPFGRMLSYTYMTDDLQVLFVDDDGAETYEDYFTDALDYNGVTYGYWPRNAGAPTGALLDNFEAIVWGTAFNFPTLDDADRAALGHYLDNGGKLFVTGQDIGWELHDIGGAAYVWYQTYLHAIFVADDTNDYTLSGVPGDPVSDGIDLVIQGGDGANNQDYPSDIDPADADSHVIWTYDANRNGAIRADNGNHRVVYMAFGFEAIDNPGDRRQAMGRIIDWLRYGSVGVSDGQPETRLSLRVDPNPMRSTSSIRFTLPAAGLANLRVFSTDGREIRSLLSGPQNAGAHVVQWDGKGHNGQRVGTGVYFYRLETDAETLVRKVVVLD